MKIEKINIKNIKMADYNPRLITTDELEKLENSINKFGLVDPIIINLKNNTIIGGHQRFKILKKQYEEKDLYLINLGDIGWVFDGIDIKIDDENTEKALNIALNNINGDWDTTKLNEILEDLTLSDFDVNLTGFDETELSFDNDDIFSEKIDEFDEDEDDFNFFDEIEDDEDDEIILRKNNTTINIGSFTIILSSFKFNQWLRRLEFKNNFINDNVKKDIMERIGFATD